MERRSESFGRFLKAGMAGIAYTEGKTQQALEDELGAVIHVAGVTLQRYKAGYLPPETESIERLAVLCVQRGLMGCTWLERFLSAARFSPHGIRAIVERLFPEVERTHARVIRPNLPPPTYTRFIMREPTFSQVLTGLASDLPVVLLVSFGGMGKTSLVRAIAGRLVMPQESTGFDTVVWISDKDHPGNTNLSTVLDTIAWVLDYPGVTALSFTDRLREITDVLQSQRVLLVIDNADTITDHALLEWLMRLPYLTKALVTSRFLLPPLSGAYVVELDPMSDSAVRELCSDLVSRSRLRHTVTVLDELAPLVASVGGNPKAIELVIGLLHHRSLDELRDELQHSSLEVFDSLFANAWNLLDASTQVVLLALSLFPTSVAAEALAYCADLSASAFRRSIELLEQLSLVDSERKSIYDSPRYNAHPLVRSYATAKRTKGAWHDQEQLLRRWLRWCLDTASNVGFCWDDLEHLVLLDREYETIQRAIHWASEQAQHQAVIDLVEGVRYYYNVRGQWGDDEVKNHERRAIAAHQLGVREHEILAIAHYVQVLSKQGRLDRAIPLSQRLVSLGQSFYQQHVETRMGTGDRRGLNTLSDDAAFEYAHALALFERACGRFDVAERYWRELLPFAQLASQQKYVITCRWLGIVLLKQQQTDPARDMLLESLRCAEAINDIRSVIGNKLKLAMIHLQRDELETVHSLLDQCYGAIMRFRDRRRLAEYHWILAQLHQKRGDLDSALAELPVAYDLYHRLGMHVEASDAQMLLKKLTP